TIFVFIIRVFTQDRPQEPKTFYIPLQLCQDKNEDGWFPVKCADDTLWIREGEYSKEYSNFILKSLSKSLTIDCQNGQMVFRPTQGQFKETRVDTSTTLAKGDSTNIVVKVTVETNPALVIKTYKNVTSVNPEPEMLTALTEAEFKNSPRTLGRLTYTRQEEQVPLSIIQDFEDNNGEAYRPFTESLLQLLRSQSWLQGHDPILRDAWKLGETISTMHHCLGQSSLAGFGAISIDENDLESWRTRLKILLDTTLTDLSQNIRALDPFAARLVETVFSERNKILRSLESYRMMLGIKKIRTHQDLHLGQILLKHGGETDFIITDFEGDPQRMDKTRMERECPLRDLGTMARSFSYLRYQVLTESHPRTKKILYQDIAAQELRAFPDLDVEKSSTSSETVFTIAKAWEQSVRRSMLQGYLNQSKELHDDFLPPETNYQTVDSISSLWEIEKAILEAKYEIHHRQQNIIIPLAGLLSLCQ
ncbi:hypothetical protein MUP37_00560, partial [Candidatus Bathyarchaeota archaeon]|nr:hypothetical protein [Candidatus Bathyarchaeota archaeon]